MVRHFFHDGGFVLHKVTGDFKGVCSAWYDSHGNLTNAEQYPSFGKSRPVRREGPMWRYLQGVGRWAGHRAAV